MTHFSKSAATDPPGGHPADPLDHPSIRISGGTLASAVRRQLILNVGSPPVTRLAIGRVSAPASRSTMPLSAGTGAGISAWQLNIFDRSAAHLAAMPIDEGRSVSPRPSSMHLSYAFAGRASITSAQRAHSSSSAVPWGLTNRQHLGHFSSSVWVTTTSTSLSATCTPS